MRFQFLSVFVLLCLVSCQGESKPAQDYSRVDTTAAATPIAKFTTLDFETNGKFCTATINKAYIDFKSKKEFPLSLFITVNTVDKNKDGLPTDKENNTFDVLEAKILTQLAAEVSYCYVGRTRMDGYRDMIFYLKEKDAKKVSEKLKAIQQSETRIKSYSFEKDEQWEAVAEFYDALKVKK